MVLVNGVRGTAKKSHFLSVVGERNSSLAVSGCSSSGITARRRRWRQMIQNISPKMSNPSSSVHPAVTIIPFLAAELFSGSELPEASGAPDVS